RPHRQFVGLARRQREGHGATPAIRNHAGLGAVAAPRAAQRLTAVALLAVGPLTWGLLLSMGLVCMRGSSGLVRHGSVRRGPAGRSSPEASQRCAAGAGLDGTG